MSEVVIVIVEAVMSITLVILNNTTMTQSWDTEVNGPFIIPIHPEENSLRTCHLDTGNIETRGISGRVVTGFSVMERLTIDPKNMCIYTYGSIYN